MKCPIPKKAMNIIEKESHDLTKVLFYRLEALENSLPDDNQTAQNVISNVLGVVMARLFVTRCTDMCIHDAQNFMHNFLDHFCQNVEITWHSVKNFLKEQKEE
jgi:hypothetical protein